MIKYVKFNEYKFFLLQNSVWTYKKHQVNKYCMEQEIGQFKIIKGLIYVFVEFAVYVLIDFCSKHGISDTTAHCSMFIIGYEKINNKQNHVLYHFFIG